MSDDLSKMEVSNEPEFSVNVALAEAIAKFEKDQASRSFSQRHPELGKMVNCAVCRSRHRAYLKCEQNFAVKHYERAFDEETQEWGPEIAVLATSERDKSGHQTKRGVNGATAYKGKRIKPPLSRAALMFVERVRVLFSYDGDIDENSDLFKAAMKIARVTANRQLRAEAREKKNKKTRQQEISRRINRGTLPGGYRD